MTNSHNIRIIGRYAPPKSNPDVSLFLFDESDYSALDTALFTAARVVAEMDKSAYDGIVYVREFLGRCLTPTKRRVLTVATDDGVKLAYAIEDDAFDPASGAKVLLNMIVENVEGCWRCDKRVLTEFLRQTPVRVRSDQMPSR